MWRRPSNVWSFRSTCVNSTSLALIESGSTAKLCDAQGLDHGWIIGTCDGDGRRLGSCVSSLVKFVEPRKRKHELEDSRWQIPDGKWQMADGRWQMTTEQNGIKTAITLSGITP